MIDNIDIDLDDIDEYLNDYDDDKIDDELVDYLMKSIDDFDKNVVFPPIEAPLLTRGP